MSNAIGNAGRLNKVITTQLAVQAALAYATGDILGGKITISGALARDGGSGILQNAILCCKSALAVNVDLVLFSADPSNTTFTENAAAAIATTDVEKVLGVLSLTTRVVLGTPVVAALYNIGMPLEAAQRDLYACLIARGAFTATATTDLILRLGIQRDM